MQVIENIRREGKVTNGYQWEHRPGCQCKSCRREGEMADPTNFRRERIEKMLHELRYEVERGMMERDIDEEMSFRFYVPISTKIPNGVVFCEFWMRPVPRHVMHPDDMQPRLKIVK